MSETGNPRDPFGGRVKVWISTFLAASAVITSGYWAVRMAAPDDTEPMESPLMLSVARQLLVGPGELYGPFGGNNPLVLIHAPLYYRVAALVAWPMYRMGWSPVDAARVAGRGISFLGLVATAMAAYRLARLGGLPPRAGWWGVLLLLASPVLQGQPVAVRPDMAGVALQTWGFLLVLEALRASAGTGKLRLLAAAILFGLAACVKQHLVAAWAIGAAMCILAWLRRRRSFAAAILVTVPGIVLAASVYGLEWMITKGRIWDAAFVAASRVGRIHPGGVVHLFVVFLGVVNRSAGLIALLTAVPLMAAGRFSGRLRMVLFGIGTLGIFLIFLTVTVHAAIELPETGAYTFFAIAIPVAAAMPALAMSLKDSPWPDREDGALWVWLAAEAGVAAVLSAGSNGAWFNYAIPAVIVGSVLAGRGLARAGDWSGIPRRLALPAGIGVLALLVSSYYNVDEGRRRERDERMVTNEIYDYYNKPRPPSSAAGRGHASTSTTGGVPRSAYFFVNRPGYNRVNGRLDMVYDHWLYPVFESISLAEPRSRWLARALVSGPVRVVISTTDAPRIEGTDLDLRRLGYRADVKQEPYYMWVR